MSSKCVKVRLNASFKRSLNGGPAVPLGEEVVAGHVGAPVGQHFCHVAQPHRGQLEGALEADAIPRQAVMDWFAANRDGCRDGVDGEALRAVVEAVGEYVDAVVGFRPCCLIPPGSFLATGPKAARSECPYDSSSLPHFHHPDRPTDQRDRLRNRCCHP
jgi:hypothetical protein